MPIVSMREGSESPELAALYERLETASGGLGVLNVFKVMAHNPELLRAWLRLATVLLSTQLNVPPRLREMAILRVFQNTRGEYGFAHHVRIGKQAGVTDAEIAALRSYATSPLFSESDRAALRYADAVANLDAKAPEEGRALAAHFPERVVMELTFVAAHWSMLARFLQPLQVPVDESLTRELSPGWRDWL